MHLGLKVDEICKKYEKIRPTAKFATFCRPTAEFATFCWPTANKTIPNTSTAQRRPDYVRPHTGAKIPCP